MDLHGLREGEALERLGRWMRDAYARRYSCVQIITGQGHHSHSGIGVLQEAVDRWVRSDGQRFVKEYGFAPASQGGRGALVLYLR